MYRGKTFTNNIDATTFNTIKLSIGEARLTVTRLTPGNCRDGPFGARKAICRVSRAADGVIPHLCQKQIPIPVPSS